MSGTEKKPAFACPELWEVQNFQGKPVKVITVPMTLEQARQVFTGRPFTKYAETCFGGNQLADDKCLLINGDATRCKKCQAPTLNKRLLEGVCPDCNGLSEFYGRDPHRPI